MLRLVIVCLFLVLSSMSSADQKPAFVQYQEPSKAELDKQQAYIQEGLKKGEDYYVSKGFQDKLQEERKKADIIPNTFASSKLELPPEVMTQKWADRFNEMEAQAGKATKSPLKGSDGPLIFASLSMSRDQLKSLAEEANRLGGAVVFRGIKDNSFIEMRKTLVGLGEGFAIDPTLFVRFNVKEVPTFLLPLEPILPCEANGCPAAKYAMVAGNVTLEGALEYIGIKSQEPGARKLSDELLKRLREK